ncbi:hypothetical protein [Haliscomenobacter sp.]|uniref:hypothetical protein n=1 Tax=Haliscomenobacter sp. TaxID=2717303 RepID=UPI003594228F
MIQFKQHRPFFGTSSSSWMLLLLSLYFSWICPAELATRPCCYDTVLVAQKPSEVLGRFYQCSLAAGKSSKTSAYLPIFSFQNALDCFQVQIKTSWHQRRQLQNLLPAPSIFSQLQIHLPRSAASC